MKDIQAGVCLTTTGNPNDEPVFCQLFRRNPIIVAGASTSIYDFSYENIIFILLFRQTDAEFSGVFDVIPRHFLLGQVCEGGQIS